MITHEALKKDIPQLHFAPEDYVSSSSPEFLAALIELIKQNGFNPDELIFSGFDGTSYLQGEPIPAYPYIFGMNQAGWSKANQLGIENPAIYAEGWATPCIGVYDRSQLTRVYSSHIRLENEFDLEDIIDGRIELTNIELGNPLADLPSDTPVEEAIVHKDYPKGSPTDALVGLVFLDENQRN